MTGWEPLIEELDRWRATGRAAQFWWRDDDAIEPTTALDQLATIGADCPITLAVIPAEATPALFDWLVENPSIVPAQHGWAHVNHALTGKKCEFGADRDRREAIDDITKGWCRLSEIARASGQRLDPLFVPPWNRIDAAIAEGLADLGPSILSVHGARRPVQRRGRLNTHVDPVNWREGAAFLGLEKALQAALRHLRAKRLGEDPDIDRTEPTGLLTHHLRHDTETWAFIDAFAALISDHPASSWISFHSAMSETADFAP